MRVHVNVAWNEQNRNQATQREADKGHGVQVGQDLQQSLAVAGEEAEAVGPRKAALHHPAARQEDKAMLCLRQRSACFELQYRSRTW